MCVLVDTAMGMPESIAKASYDYYFYPDLVEEQSGYVWDKFFIHPQQYTPPGSPNREDECCEMGDDAFDGETIESEGSMQLMPTSELFDCEQTNIPYHTNPVLQDCMWSGVERKPVRSRHISLSELSMATTSTSFIDPTTFTAYPRQHNQVEHNYSLATPEPMKVPKTYSNYNTPSTSENSGKCWKLQCYSFAFRA